MTKEFDFNFIGLHTKIGVLELLVSPKVVSLVIEIPRGQEKWFKNFKFKMAPCRIFLKLEFLDTDLTKVVPRGYVKYVFANLLLCIQRYFTCEGRYHKVYPYHFKLRLHFTGIISLDLPFFLFRSLGKMSDKIQLKIEPCETSLFHHGLVKLMVLHELQNVDRYWYTFLFMSSLRAETRLSPRAKEISSPVISHHAEERSSKFVKLKARKQVLERMTRTPLAVQDTPQQSQ